MKTSRPTQSAPCSTSSRVRLVTITAQPGLPGSSGNNSCSLVTPSKTSSNRLLASRLRYSSARSSTSSGMAGPVTPSARRNRASWVAVPVLGRRPAQVGVQMPVRIGRRRLVRDPQRQRRLAHPAPAEDADDRDGESRRRPTAGRRTGSG